MIKKKIACLLTATIVGVLGQYYIQNNKTAIEEKNQTTQTNQTNKSNKMIHPIENQKSVGEDLDSKIRFINYPNYSQYSPNLPNNGEMYCGPAVVANIVGFLDSIGLNVLNSPIDKFNSTKLIKNLGEKMKTDKDTGTKSLFNLIEGLHIYFDERDYIANFDYKRLNENGKYEANDLITFDWIKQNSVGKKNIILSINYSKNNNIKLDNQEELNEDNVRYHCINIVTVNKSNNNNNNNNCELIIRDPASNINNQYKKITLTKNENNILYISGLNKGKYKNIYVKAAFSVDISKKSNYLIAQNNK